MATWTDITFSYKEKLTSAKMTLLDGNLDALAEGSSGAPSMQTNSIQDSAVTLAKLADDAIAEIVTYAVMIQGEIMALKGKIAYADAQSLAHGNELTILSDTGIGTTYSIYLLVDNWIGTPDFSLIYFRAYIDGEGSPSINIPIYKLFNWRTSANKDTNRQMISYTGGDIMEAEGLIKIAYATSISLRIYSNSGAGDTVLVTYRIESVNK